MDDTPRSARTKSNPPSCERKKALDPRKVLVADDQRRVGIPEGRAVWPRSWAVPARRRLWPPAGRRAECVRGGRNCDLRNPGSRPGRSRREAGRRISRISSRQMGRCVPAGVCPRARTFSTSAAYGPGESSLYFWLNRFGWGSRVAFAAVMIAQWGLAGRTHYTATGPTIVPRSLKPV